MVAIVRANEQGKELFIPYSITLPAYDQTLTLNNNNPATSDTPRQPMKKPRQVMTKPRQPVTKP